MAWILPTRLRDEPEKKVVYAHNGVDEYWVIDPGGASIMVFSRNGRWFDGGRTFTAGAIASPLFPDLDATVEEILAR